jgi:hypothetical protein
VLEIRYGSGVAIHEMAMIAKGNFFFIPWGKGPEF